MTMCVLACNPPQQEQQNQPSVEPVTTTPESGTIFTDEIHQEGTASESLPASMREENGKVIIEGNAVVFYHPSVSEAEANARLKETDRLFMIEVDKAKSELEAADIRCYVVDQLRVLAEPAKGQMHDIELAGKSPRLGTIFLAAGKAPFFLEGSRGQLDIVTYGRGYFGVK
jgi:hypothetical protein